MPFFFRCTLIFLLIVSCFAQFTQAQQQPLAKAIAENLQENSNPVAGGLLHLHLDKSLYITNENIWFKATLLKNVDSIVLHHTLYVLLSNKFSREIVATEKFVMEDGFSAGYIFLPDSLHPGDYNFIAYTNQLAHTNNPVIFQQEIGIRGQSAIPAFQLSFQDIKKEADGDSISFVTRVTNKQLHYAEGATIAYKILDNDNVLTTGKALVNKYGEVPLKFKYNRVSSELALEAQIIDKKDTSYVRQPLSVLEQYVQFKFYPESGDWIEGINSTTAFEVINLSGKPVALEGYIIEDGKQIARIRSNAAGMGIVNIRPKPGKKYDIKLDAQNKVMESANFPVVQSSGYQIQVENAVVKDTLVVVVHKMRSPKKTQLVLHNYEELYTLVDLPAEKDRLTIKIPANEIPAGLATLTLFDDNEIPVAERTVFLHYQKQPLLQIEIDSLKYHQRSKVKMKLKLTDEKGKPLKGIFSMAAVSSQRIDPASFQDIVPYYYFGNYIQNKIIPRAALSELGTETDIEMFLLTKCWTRYKQATSKPLFAVLPKQEILDVTGFVLKKNKVLKKPAQLVLFAENGKFKEVATDSAGHFIIPPEFLAVEGGQFINLLVNEKDKEDYAIVFNSEKNQLDSFMVQQSFAKAMQVRGALPVEEIAVLEKTKTLSTVVVKAKIEKTGWGAGEFVSKNCNDYVCMYNILNCPNHPTGSLPVDGQTYNYRGQSVVYKSCRPKNENPLFTKIKGRNYTKEFYKADYTVFNPAMPEILSTLYWEPHFSTDEDGEVELSFYTNDLKGPFVCIVQGITNQGVVSGRKNFTVIDK